MYKKPNLFMKHIVFVRHAKASKGDSKTKDFDRPLTEKGRQDALEMSIKLKALNFHPELIVCSSSKRTMETAMIYARNHGIETQGMLRLYHAMPETYESVLQDLDESINSVIIVGHNPGISFIADIANPGKTTNLPTCGMIITKISIEKWPDCTLKELNLISIEVPSET